jgi:hypothetical protein
MPQGDNHRDIYNDEVLYVSDLPTFLEVGKSTGNVHVGQ